MAQTVGTCVATMSDGLADRQRRAVKVNPEWRVYVLGATLFVGLTTCSRNFGDRGGPYFMAALALAGIAYLLAVREFFVRPSFSHRLVVIGLVLAAAWHVE